MKQSTVAIISFAVCLLASTTVECQAKLPPPPPSPPPTAPPLTTLPVPSSAPTPKVTPPPAPAASAAPASAAAAPALVGKLTADQAKNHIGENATVCGVVAGTHYAADSRRTPTFVNLDKPYPNSPFTVVIWGDDLAKFNPKPTTWDGKRVCATGEITSYQGHPEIVAKSPGQITVQ